MNDFNPFAVFVGISFAVGFAARTIVGGYRRMTAQVQVAPDVVEEVTIEDVPVELSSPISAPKLNVNVNERIYSSYAKSIKSELADHLDFLKSVEKPYKEELIRLGSEHSQRVVYNSQTPSFKNPPYTIRILPPAANHEVFAKSLIPDERYYYNVIVRGDEASGPKVLCVGPALHRKIVEAFMPDDDISDLVSGSDIQITLGQEGDTRVNKLHRSPLVPLGSIPQANNWLLQTSNLNLVTSVAVVPPVPPVVAPDYPAEKKLVSFNFSTDLYDFLKTKSKEEKRSVTDILEDMVRKHMPPDEAENRQKHFSKGEKVRISDPSQNFNEIINSFLSNTKLVFDKRLLASLKFPHLIATGQIGKVVDFVMEKNGDDIVPYREGCAFVDIDGVGIVVMKFNGIESIEHGALKNAISVLKVGDWVRWKTQEGHTSKRPSVVFKTRKTKFGNEVQLGYTGGKATTVKKFWCPASKCKPEIPPHQVGPDAHLMPDELLAKLLKNVPIANS